VIGELVVRWGSQLLVGFENHSGGTYLGETAQPLGRVLAGHGNNGDGSEGVVKGAAVGTNLRGPCLPKNPALADFLITAAVSRRHGPAELQPLADELEGLARDAAVDRARLAARPGRARLGRAVLRRPPGFRPAGRTRLARTAGQPEPRTAATRARDVRPADARPASTGAATQDGQTGVRR
jgi:hypothetical protein